MTDSAAAFAAPDGSLIQRMQMRIGLVSAQLCEGSMPVEGNRQIHGLLHGGASAALAETVGSLAAAAHAGQGRVALGIELNISHHAAATSGDVHARATATHLGKTLANYIIEVTDDAGRRIASARLTCLIRDAPHT